VYVFWVSHSFQLTSKSSGHSKISRAKASCLTHMVQSCCSHIHMQGACSVCCSVCVAVCVLQCACCRVCCSVCCSMLQSLAYACRVNTQGIGNGHFWTHSRICHVHTATRTPTHCNTHCNRVLPKELGHCFNLRKLSAQSNLLSTLPPEMLRYMICVLQCVLQCALQRALQRALYVAAHTAAR